MEKQFNDAAERVQHLPQRPGTDMLLELYALYKQAREGDVSGKRPGFVDFNGRAKYDSWGKQKGKASDAAMQEYIDLVQKLEEEMEA